MKILNLKEIGVPGEVAYVTPEIHVYEIGIEDSILIVSGKTPPSMGYEDGEGWS